MKHDAEVQPPRSRPAARTDPRRGQRAVRRAQLRRGLDRGHRQLRRRHARARAPLLRRPQGGLHRAARAARRRARATTPAARGPQRPRARGRQRVALARLDRAEPHDLARHARPRRGHRRPRRQGRRRSTWCAAPSRYSPPTTPTSPTTHHGCATRSNAGPDSTAPPHAAGYKAKPPASRPTNCSPQHSNTSYAPSAPHPRQEVARGANFGHATPSPTSGSPLPWRARAGRDQVWVTHPPPRRSVASDDGRRLKAAETL